MLNNYDSLSVTKDSNLSLHCGACRRHMYQTRFMTQPSLSLSKTGSLDKAVLAMSCGILILTSMRVSRYSGNTCPFLRLPMKAIADKIIYLQNLSQIEKYATARLRATILEKHDLAHTQYHFSLCNKLKKRIIYFGTHILPTSYLSASY